MNDLNIYQVSNDFMQLLDKAIDQETGEIKDKECLDLWLNCKMALEEKVENTISVYEKYGDNIDLAKNKIKELQHIIDVYESRQNSIKNLLDNVMSNVLKTKKYENGLNKISYRKSDSVEIINENEIPKKFMKEKITYSPDKMAIKEAIKKGEAVDGVSLLIKENIQIKGVA